MILMIKLLLIIIFSANQLVFKFFFDNFGQSFAHVVGLWFGTFSLYLSDLIIKHGLIEVLLLVLLLGLAHDLVLGFLRLRYQKFHLLLCLRDSPFE